MTRHALCLLLAATMIVGCGEKSSDPGPAAVARSTDVFNLRNLARLHGGRDTREGYADAAAVCERIVALPEADGDDWLNLARAHLLGEVALAKAAEPLKRARELFESAPPALDYLDGLLAKSAGDEDAALAAFGRAVAVLPEHPEALFQCGYAAERAGNAAEAERCYRKLVAGGPLLVPAAYRLSQVLIRAGDEEGAKFLALFNEKKTDNNPETVKCDLTEIRIRPGRPADHEPPEVKLEWHESTRVEISSVDEAIGDAGDVATGDIDNDGDVESVLSRPDGLYLRDGDGVRLIVHGSGAAADLELFDFDHDGDLDILVLEEKGAYVTRNDGDGTFSIRKPFADRPAGGARLDCHDVDQANDLDVIVPGREGDATLWLNLRGDRYRPVTVEGTTGRTILCLFDVDADGAPDVFATGGAPGFVLRRNLDADGRPYEARLGEPEAGGSVIAHDAEPADIDNDGDLDVLVAGPAGLTVLRNRAGTLVEEPPFALPGGVTAEDVLPRDIDGDGVLEAVVVGATGGAVLLDPGDVGGYESLVLAPVGKKDNTGAIGTITEVFTGRRYQNKLIRNAGGLHVGLGPDGRARFDGFALRWPQGILQSVPRASDDPPLDRIAIDQKEGLIASCPFLYTRAADGWRFITDVIGIAPLDEWLPPGGTPHLDPEEWVRIPGDALAIEEGRVTLAITEELRETAHVDRLRLAWVDHAPGVEVTADESTRQGAYDPLAPLALGGVSAARRVTAGERDVSGLVAERDGRYLHAYPEAPTQWSGWVERHEIEIVTAAPARWLVLDGRIAWYDSTVVYALAQHGRTWGPLRLSRLTADGAAEVLVEDAGVPAGMDRTMLVDCGRELPAGTRLVLSGQHRFLWDRVRTAARAATVELPEPLVTAAPARAFLYERGLSRLVGDASLHEQTYDWNDAAPDDSYPRPRGAATRYGDVLPLLGEHDDLACVLVCGDACEVAFAVPPIPAGRERTWFLCVTGWAKEAGYHNRSGTTIGPLPRRGEVHPPLRPRSDAAWSRYLEEWQTRRIR